MTHWFECTENRKTYYSTEVPVVIRYCFFMKNYVVRTNFDEDNQEIGVATSLTAAQKLAETTCVFS